MPTSVPMSATRFESRRACASLRSDARGRSVRARVVPHARPGCFVAEIRGALDGTPAADNSGVEMMDVMSAVVARDVLQHGAGAKVRTARQPGVHAPQLGPSDPDRRIEAVLDVEAPARSTACARRSAGEVADATTSELPVVFVSVCSTDPHVVRLSRSYDGWVGNR